MAANGVEDLIADLDELSEDEGNDSARAYVDSRHVQKRRKAMATANGGLNGYGDEMDTDDGAEISHDVMDDDDDEEEERVHKQRPKRRTATYSPLLHSEEFQKALTKIAEYRYTTFQETEGGIQDHPEYNLIVQVNKLTHDIDTEIMEIHKVIRDLYAPRFPELEPLVPNALDYARTVKAIGNPDDMRSLDKLKGILPSATIMVVKVTAATTAGRKLDAEEWEKVEACCDMALQLEADKKGIIEYIESRMRFIAPNFCEVVGSGVAARLMGAAGGITALSKVPACNLPLLGAVKKNATGLSNVSSQRHTGFLFTCELVKNTPPEFKMKAQRLTAAKATLALRVDLSRSSRDGEAGRKFSDQVRVRLEKLLEPPPKSTSKALPVPDEGGNKKRGGRRARAQKQAIAVTEMQKQQNRMAFGVKEEESYIGDEAEGLGMLAPSGAKSDDTKRIFGKVRSAAVNKKTQPKTSEKMKQRLKAYSGGSNGGTVSGLSSSLAFTPVQGLEFVNPEAQREKLRQANERWFSKGGGFSKVKEANANDKSDQSKMVE